MGKSIIPSAKSLPPIIRVRVISYAVRFSVNEHPLFKLSNSIYINVSFSFLFFFFFFFRVLEELNDTATNQKKKAQFFMAGLGSQTGLLSYILGQMPTKLY